LEFRKQIKTIAFADDSLVSVKTQGVGEAEYNTNLGMNKILIWAKNNKIKFNEQKSNVMFKKKKKKRRKGKLQFT
jgi:hypothetical protein